MAITCYTDPLCCWSWAMEQQWQQWLNDIGRNITVNYKMVGLLPAWDKFQDTVNAISRPVQMGPEWMHARHLSGASIDDRIWIVDPPASSFPACIAVKAAQLQSAAHGAVYLRLAREAVMARMKNIARTNVLIELAEKLKKSNPAFDVERFRNDLTTRGLEAFKQDYQESKYLGISRFPTVVSRLPDGRTFRISGYQTYNTLVDFWRQQVAG